MHTGLSRKIETLGGRVCLLRGVVYLETKLAALEHALSTTISDSDATTVVLNRFKASKQRSRAEAEHSGQGTLFVQMHEHAACALDPDGLSNTRTTLTSPLINFVMWNMSYHAEHHLYTILPFHALPRAHALLKQNLVNLSEGGHLSVHRQVLGSWILDTS